jgi:hypothetical protein
VAPPNHSTEPDPRATRFGEIALYVAKLMVAVALLALVVGWILR